MRFNFKFIDDVCPLYFLKNQAHQSAARDTMQTADVQEDLINGLTTNSSRGRPSMFQVFRLPRPLLLLLIFASSLQFQACLSDITIVTLACKKLSSVSFALVIGQEGKKPFLS